MSAGASAGAVGEAVSGALAEAVTDHLLAELRLGLAAQGWLQVEASGRHLHISVDDAKALFGPDYALTWVKQLSQPGQFVGQERIALVGPNGQELTGVVVLGPERGQTQIEVSKTDALQLGVDPPCRESGKLEGTPSIRVTCGQAAIVTGGLIIAERHIHMRTDTAASLGIQDGQRVDFELRSERPLVFLNVKVRVSGAADNFMHIDYDEANAAGFQRGMFGRIIKA